MERDKKEPFDEKKDYDFNSHAHVERDHWFNAVKSEINDFNSHAHVERDGRGVRTWV